MVVARAASAEDHALRVTAQSESATLWSEDGNDALVLDVTGNGGRLIGHLVMHQGAVAFEYAMHVGALARGEAIALRISTLSAANATRKACAKAELVPVSAMGAAGEGVSNAPIFRWPVQKRFDDLPMVVGWSRALASYETVYSNENGGTVRQCGGGAAGIRAEIARWGRAADIEGNYAYADTPRWLRCTGTTDVAATPLRMEGSHPILYYGDGHNRLFESRGGYGQACGIGVAEKADGDLEGWNTKSSSDALSEDAGKVIIVRPLPVDLDAIDYAAFPGRREALIDRYAPWLYRITALELERERKIDDLRTFAMDRYLYADVRVADVGGVGDELCAFSLMGGFKLHAVTAGGQDISGPQITADYAGDGAHDWKRVAIPLPAGVRAADIAAFRFEGFDGDGIYLTAIGDAFVAEAAGDNGATLDYARRGERALADYVDIDSKGCTAGTNTDGPGGTPYTCVGALIELSK
ncbi:MAG TPA: hypothetical protein VFD36_24905 [Kofleriaceae bacterium]|nr:hypothetical protein [Kofleriaceae bacterium]